MAANSYLPIQNSREPIATVEGKPCFLTPSWDRWLRTSLYDRVGGANAIAFTTMAVDLQKVILAESATNGVALRALAMTPSKPPRAGAGLAVGHDAAGQTFSVNVNDTNLVTTMRSLGRRT